MEDTQQTFWLNYIDSKRLIPFDPALAFITITGAWASHPSKATKYDKWSAFCIQGYDAKNPINPGSIDVRQQTRAAAEGVEGEEQASAGRLLQD